MKFFVQHPYKERIELNIGAITQIVGQNNELKYYTWQILNWYFGGKKYSSEDLSIFDYEEPTILDEVGEIVKRNSYHYIDISSLRIYWSRWNTRKEHLPTLTFVKLSIRLIL